MTETVANVTLPLAAEAPLDELVRALGDRVLIASDDVARFSADASRARSEGRPLAVVLATCTEDVSVALRWATRFRIAISVRGSGTGLAGGAVAYPGGLVVSLERLNRIIGIDPVTRIAEVQAGVITAEIDRAAAEHGLMYAPDPASYRESTIGGNIATNAGGLRCVKYGVTGDSVAGLEVVLATGSVIRTGSATVKNAVGYDLTSLFVGSEGTLGVVTAARVRLIPRPSGEVVTFRAAFSSLESAGRAVSEIMLGSTVPEVLEMMDRHSVAAVERHYPTGLHIDGADAILVGQFIGSGAGIAVREVARVCHAAGAVSVDLADGDVLLEARRVSGPALSAEGLRVSSDIAVPVSRVAEMFGAIERISAEEGVMIPTFAHAGDGNFHPSVIVDRESEHARLDAERIIDRISDAALALGGTLTGEHGVGSLKLESLSKQMDAETRAAHVLIKSALDPAGILTPGRGI